MESVTLEWAASVGGIGVLVGLGVRLTKNLLKTSGDIWVNISTIIYSVVLNTLAFVVMGRTTGPELYLLVAQIIIVAAAATFGYEVVSNLRGGAYPLTTRDSDLNGR